MDPLAQLKDIHTPQTVDWWPLAWGWWALLAIAVVVLCIVMMTIYRRFRFNRARREAIAVHKMLDLDCQYPAKANQLLKRVSLHYFGKEQSAAAYGESWQRFLLGCLSSKQQSNTASGINLLAQFTYQAQPLNADQISEIHRAVSIWLQHARLKHPPHMEVTTDV